MDSMLQPPASGLLGARLVEVSELTSESYAVFGAPFGTPYRMEGVASDAAQAPRLFRERANQRFGAHADRYDFSLGGTLFGGTQGELVDLGDLVGDPRQLAENARAVTETTAAILAAGAIPVVLGGDDSVPILVARGYGARPEPGINVLQIDAHIDFVDEVAGEREGYSSTMRRIREMPWVHDIVQVGARGTGSARPGDVEAARAAGNRIVTAQELRNTGVAALISQLDRTRPWFVTFDVDGLDPTIAPGTSCPVPGGLSFPEAEELLAAVGGELGLAGIDIVEHFPSLDQGNTTSVTLARLLSVLIGRSARKEVPCI